MGGEETKAQPETAPRDPSESFDSAGADHDPVGRFRRWAEEARSTGSLMTDIAILGTSSPHGVPSARAVILRGVDHRGFVFFTNYESPKARDLEAYPDFWSSDLISPHDGQHVCRRGMSCRQPGSCDGARPSP